MFGSLLATTNAPDPSCEPFEVVPCNTLVTEATFALPVYKLGPQGKPLPATFIVGGKTMPSLGKPRFCCVIRWARPSAFWPSSTAFTDQTVHLHGSSVKLVEAYRQAGIQMLPTEAVSALPKDNKLPQGLVLAPPSVGRKRMASAIQKPKRGLCQRLDGRAWHPQTPQLLTGFCDVRPCGLGRADCHHPRLRRTARAVHPWAQQLAGSLSK